MATPADRDGHAAGVFADWLQENREEVLTTAPAYAAQLDAMISSLRAAFANPRRNQMGPQ